MDFKGVIIEESLADNSVLKNLNILKTRKEKVTTKHKTPWLTQWTLHTITIPEENMEKVAITLSKSIDTTHENSWYIDFKNDLYHYIIFKNKIFQVELAYPLLYKKAREYGTSLGIPPYQMQFERLQR